MPGTHELHRFQTDDPCLAPIHDKVVAGRRLDAPDALALYRTGDILAIGWMANFVRERMHGDKTYFNVNRHINPTNVCVAACRLCFRPQEGCARRVHDGARRAFETAASGTTEAVTEFHIVGGLHPDLPFQYFLDLCAGLKQRFPQVHLKAFTMVEVAYLARRAKLSIRETLEQLKDAGVDSLPGGGAEIFADRVRHIICDHKIDGDQWLDTAQLAHQIGLNRTRPCSTATSKTTKTASTTCAAARAAGRNRRLPDVHPAGLPSRQHAAAASSKTTGLIDIKQIAVSRLMLDNFPHIKAYWQMMTAKIAQISLALRRRRPGRHGHR